MSANEITTDEVKTFSKVSFEGLEAYADAYAIREDIFKFLSLFGSRVSVRAIWSALFSGASVVLEGMELRTRSEDSWQVFQRILPSGALHAVLYPKLVDLARIQNEFIVLGKTKEAITDRFYLYLDRTSETPISPEWSEWILKEALETGKALWLKTLHLSALAYEHEESWFENLVTGVLRGQHKLEV